MKSIARAPSGSGPGGDRIGTPDDRSPLPLVRCPPSTAPERHHRQAQLTAQADEFGREAVLSELYGVTNWDFNFLGHKAQGDWQAALGVTVRVPHLAWVSMAGESKRDYPAPLSYWKGDKKAGVKDLKAGDKILFGIFPFYDAWSFALGMLMEAGFCIGPGIIGSIAGAATNPDRATRA